MMINNEFWKWPGSDHLLGPVKIGVLVCFKHSEKATKKQVEYDRTIAPILFFPYASCQVVCCRIVGYKFPSLLLTNLALLRMMPALKLGKSIAKVWVGPNRPRPQYNEVMYQFWSRLFRKKNTNVFLSLKSGPKL